MTNANQVLMGSGAPAAKFDHVGATVTGTLTREPEARQQTEFRTGIPLTWKDGSPRMQVVVQLATDQRDPMRPDDDGTRSLYIKGKQLTDAIRSAVRTAGADGLHIGGRLTVQYVADGPADPGLTAPKLYAASYTAPAQTFAGVTPPSAPTPAYTATAVPVSAPAGPPPSVNIDPAMWAQLSPDQQAAIAANATLPPF